MAGATISPSSIFARNAKPSAAPANASHLALARSNARTVQYARGRHEQHHDGVGVVVSEHQRHHRGQREQRTGEQARIGPCDTTNRAVEQRHRCHGHQRFRHEHAGTAEAEDLTRQPHYPLRHRWLVDGDEVVGIHRSEKQRLPVLRARLCSARIELVAHAVDSDVPQVGDRCGDQQNTERDATTVQAVEATSNANGDLARRVSSRYRLQRRSHSPIGSSQLMCPAMSELE